MKNELLDPVVTAADNLHDILYPPDGATLPRFERVDKLKDGISHIAGVLIERSQKAPLIDDKLIFAAGAYCAADGYLAITENDSIDQVTADVTAANFNDTGEFFMKQSKYWREDRLCLGAIAEFAVLQTIWNSIRDGAVDGYAFMARSPDWGGSSNGLRSDIDIVGKLNGNRQNLQVKLAKHKESHIYKKGITVISPQSLAGRAKRDSLYYLLTVDRKEASDRFDVYERLATYL